MIFCLFFSLQNKSKSKTVQKLEAINAELQLQTLETSKKLNLSDTLNGANRTATRTSPLKEALSPELGVLLPPKSNQVVIPYSGGEAQSGIAKDTRTVASQTLETSFVPCEACACVQLSLKSVTDMIVEVCESQGLPSAMARHRSQEVVATMTASDVSRWTKEQGKDLDRIRKHLQDLLAQIDPPIEEAPPPWQVFPTPADTHASPALIRCCAAKCAATSLGGMCHTTIVLIVVRHIHTPARQDRRILSSAGLQGICATQFVTREAAAPAETPMHAIMTVVIDSRVPALV